MNLDLIRQKLATRAGLPSADQRRAVRMERGLTQADLAAALGVAVETVARWERGEALPRGQRLNEYVALLDELLKHEPLQ